MCSKKSNNLIDVNQNDNLLSSSYKLSGDQQAAEWQEQVKAYKQELEKKDELLANFSTMTPRSENGSINTSSDSSSTITSSARLTRAKLYSVDCPSADLAAARIKIENLTTENRELIAKLDLKENFLEDSRSKIHLLKENDARQSVIIQALKDEVQHLKKKSDALEKITDKGTVTIATLQSEHQEALEKVELLEANLRKIAMTKEELEGDRESFKLKYFDLVTILGEAMNIDTEDGQRVDIAEVFASTGKNLRQEHLLLQSRIQTLEDALSAHSLETKASRETIMRLVSEVGKEQKITAEAASEVEKMKQERLDVTAEKESLVREIELLKSRLEANDKTWVSSREELTQTASKASLLAEELKRVEVERNAVKSEYKFFCENLAQILSNPFLEVSPVEDSIRKRIKDLVVSDQEKKNRIDELEAKVVDISSDQQCHHDTAQTSMCLVKKAEKSLCASDNRVADLEDELATGEVIRDTLRRDKNKYLAFLQEMAEAMKMEEVAADLGYDFNTDVLVARAHQLAKLESDALIEKTSSNYNLQRKLKAMKEEVRSKEMSMELLRKKIAQLEEKNRTRNGLALDRDDAIVTAQRLHRKVERLQHALGDERVKVAQLKFELEKNQQLKVVTFEQRKKIDQLANSVGRLSTAKDRQRQKLSSLKRNLSATEMDAEHRNARLEMNLQKINEDLELTKSALDDVTRREKQLLDFREMVARILGMDVAVLSVPDYEVISRLEKLIRQQQIGLAAATVPESTFNTTNPRYRGGLDGYRTQTPSPYHSPNPPASPKDSDGGHGPKRSYRRSRSSSPKRY